MQLLVNETQCSFISSRTLLAHHSSALAASLVSTLAPSAYKKPSMYLKVFLLFTSSHLHTSQTKNVLFLTGEHRHLLCSHSFSK